MFEVGFTEIILIVGLALIVLGPEKLPGLVKTVGRWTGRARAMARQLQTQLEHEVALDEISKARPMQGGTPPASNDVTNNHTHQDAGASSVDQATAHSHDGHAAESAVDAATGTDSARPVDLTKPLQ